MRSGTGVGPGICRKCRPGLRNGLHPWKNRFCSLSTSRRQAERLAFRFSSGGKRAGIAQNVSFTAGASPGTGVGTIGGGYLGRNGLQPGEMGSHEPQGSIGRLRAAAARLAFSATRRR
jgi:hypothetical protein